MVASVLDADELDEWGRVRDAMVEALSLEELERTAEGERAAAGGADVPESGSGAGAPELFVATPAFLEAIDAGWISLGALDVATLANWLELDTRVRTGTVGVWLLPA